MFVHPTPKPALKTALAILGDAFDGVASVSAQMPRTLPSKFVVVERVGGARPNLVTDSARILVQCFAETPEAVESMCGTVDEAMHNAAGTVVDGVFVRAWGGQQGPTRLPHPDVLTRERWQIHGNLVLSTTTPS